MFQCLASAVRLCLAQGKHVAGDKRLASDVCLRQAVARVTAASALRQLYDERELGCAERGLSKAGVSSQPGSAAGCCAVGDDLQTAAAKANALHKQTVASSLPCIARSC